MSTLGAKTNSSQNQLPQEKNLLSTPPMISNRQLQKVVPEGGTIHEVVLDSGNCAHILTPNQPIEKTQLLRERDLLELNKLELIKEVEVGYAKYRIMISSLVSEEPFLLPFQIFQHNLRNQAMKVKQRLEQLDNAFLEIQNRLEYINTLLKKEENNNLKQNKDNTRKNTEVCQDPHLKEMRVNLKAVSRGLTLLPQKQIVKALSFEFINTKEEATFAIKHYEAMLTSPLVKNKKIIPRKIEMLKIQLENLNQEDCFKELKTEHQKCIQEMQDWVDKIKKVLENLINSEDIDSDAKMIYRTTIQSLDEQIKIVLENQVPYVNTYPSNQILSNVTTLNLKIEESFVKCQSERLLKIIEEAKNQISEANKEVNNLKIVYNDLIYVSLVETSTQSQSVSSEVGLSNIPESLPMDPDSFSRLTPLYLNLVQNKQPMRDAGTNLNLDNDANDLLRSARICFKGT